jgi:hypothetical protein
VHDGNEHRSGELGVALSRCPRRFGGRLNLLGEDVGVTGVPGDFGDHAQIDESRHDVESCCSTTTLGTLNLASSRAAASPTGPPPTMITGLCDMV